MRKITILVVGSASLARLIGHIFHDSSEFEVINVPGGIADLGREAGRLLPELIVATVKPVSIRICLAVASIKESSPLSKLIMICPVEDLVSVARKCGADACLRDEKLARHLPRTARNLARPKIAGAGD